MLLQSCSFAGRDYFLDIKERVINFGGISSAEKGESGVLRYLEEYPQDPSNHQYAGPWVQHV